MPQPKVELAEVLAGVSEQLIAADARAKERHRPVLQFEECEVEFAVKLEVGAKGGVKFWVIELGANAKSENSSKVKVKFRAATGTRFFAQGDPKGPIA